MQVSIRNAKGFSLVELMVVVAIIGILAAIAVPNFQRFASKSKQSEAKSNLAAVYSAERAFQSEWQMFRSDFRLTGYAPTGNLRYRHGFTGENGTALPAGFSMQPSNIIATTAYCAIPANKCVEIISPINPGAIPNSTTAPTTFTSAATGDISGGAFGLDTWSINESKTLTNIQTGF